MMALMPTKKTNTKKKKIKTSKKKKFNYSSQNYLQPGSRGHIIGPSSNCHIPGYTISSGTNTNK